MKKTLDLVQKH